MATSDATLDGCAVPSEALAHSQTHSKQLYGNRTRGVANNSSPKRFDDLIALYVIQICLQRRFRDESLR